MEIVISKDFFSQKEAQVAHLTYLDMISLSETQEELLQDVCKV